MFNLRNNHVPSLRTEFAAVGPCLCTAPTAAGTAPSRFGMALTGVACRQMIRAEVQQIS
jgi:hypothetical protein